MGSESSPNEGDREASRSRNPAGTGSGESRRPAHADDGGANGAFCEGEEARSPASLDLESAAEGFRARIDSVIEHVEEIERRQDEIDSLLEGYVGG